MISWQTVNVAFLACENFDDVLNTFKKAKQLLGEILSGTRQLTHLICSFSKRFITEMLLF